MMLELLRQEYLNFLLLLPPGVSEVDVDVGNREAPWETRIHLMSAQASAQDSPVQRAPAKLPQGPWLMVKRLSGNLCLLLAQIRRRSPASVPTLRV